MCSDLWTFFSFGIQDSGWNPGSKLLFLLVFWRSQQCADTPLSGKLGALGLPSVLCGSCIWNLFLSTLMGSPLTSRAPARLDLLGSRGHAPLSPGVGEGGFFSSLLLRLRYGPIYWLVGCLNQGQGTRKGIDNHFSLTQKPNWAQCSPNSRDSKWSGGLGLLRPRRKAVKCPVPSCKGGGWKCSLLSQES